MRAILWPLRLVSAVLRLGTGAAVLMTFLVMLAINVATITIPAVATAVSAAAGAMGLKTVAARQATALAATQRTAASRAAIIKRQRGALQRTAARVSGRMATGATRSVSTSFGQSIPVFGAAVVAGVTAWEIRDACATIEDLAALEAEVDDGFRVDPELERAIGEADPEDVQSAERASADATKVCGLSVPSTTEIWNRVRTEPAEIWREMRGRGLDLPETSEVRERFFQLDLPGWPDIDVPPAGDLMDAVRRWWGGADGPSEPLPTEPTQ
jgi:hypothetical protein